jgi:CRP/FNR family nitrogen fixation transcriptional regulator
MEVTNKVQGCALERTIASFPASLEQSGVRVLCQRSELLRQARDPDDWWGRVISGAVATCALLADGRRHVIEFLFPGDLFGMQPLAFAELRMEAISSPTVYVRYPRERIERAADTDPLVARQIREATLQTLARLQGQTVLLGRGRAVEKIAAFLLEMAARARRRSDGSVVLPMSRYDIADHLGIAVETVSRVLSELRSRGTICVRGGRTVQILNRSALEQLNAEGAAWSRNSASAQLPRAHRVHGIPKQVRQQPSSGCSLSMSTEQLGR